MAIESLREGPVIAIPGERTSAFAALSLCLGRGAFRYVSVPFDQILPALDAGEFDAGLIIHEGQLTFEDHALHLIVDLGQWWRSRTGLPLPLGMNAIRRDLDALGGPGTIAHLARILEQSVRYAMEHREESIRRVLPWARGMGGELAAKFVDLYVNRWTLDFGEQGLAAVRLFLTQTAQIGLTPALGAMEPIAASHTAADSGYAASR